MRVATAKSAAFEVGDTEPHPVLLKKKKSKDTVESSQNRTKAKMQKMKNGKDTVETSQNPAKAKRKTQLFYVGQNSMM